MPGILRYNAGMVESWFFLESPPADAATNMALDEALLRTAGERRRPLLRVYAWSKPAVSFGYFQKFPAHLAGQYEIVRRPTGGGVVYHINDTTYTVVAPADDALSKMMTSDAYCALHRAVAAAFDSVPTLHADKILSPQGEYECFQKPVHGDVVAEGRKLAGGAQRRTKWGLLHQGSIAARITGRQLQTGFRAEFGITFSPHEVSEKERALAEKLVREKYATDVWNKRVG